MLRERGGDHDVIMTLVSIRYVGELNDQVGFGRGGIEAVENIAIGIGTINWSVTKQLIKRLKSCPLSGIYLYDYLTVGW